MPWAHPTTPTPEFCTDFPASPPHAEGSGTGPAAQRPREQTPGNPLSVFPRLAEERETQSIGQGHAQHGQATSEGPLSAEAQLAAG